MTNKKRKKNFEETNVCRDEIEGWKEMKKRIVERVFGFGFLCF